MSLSAFLARSRAESPAVLTHIRQRPRLVLLHCLWVLSLVPLAEIAYWTYTKEITHYRVLGFDYMWKLPIGYSLIFLPIAAVLYGLARFRQAATLPAIVFTGAFVGITGALPLVWKGLHYWAVLLLAAGAAVQISRLSERHAHLWHLVARRTVLFTTLFVAGLAIGFSAWPYWQERRTVAALPAASPSAPNIILIVLDTVRAKSLSLYGYGRRTSPNLDQFAARGVVFERALSTSPWTLPSHASMFTGRFPHELSASWATPLDATHPTVAEILSGRGYLTAGFSANVGYAGAAFGVGRGFAHFEDKPTTAYLSVAETSFGSQFIRATKLQDRFGTHDNLGRKSAERISADFLRWFSGQERSRPFFAFLNYYDAHAPYLPPAEFARKFSSTRARSNPWSRALDAWSPEDVKAFNDAYDGAIAYLDDQLGRLFSALEARKVLDNTVLIITSDHGEHFGEHKLLDHSASLYMPLLHVPLAVIYPSRLSARRVTTPVSLRDMAATILDFSGSGVPPAIPGQSLLSLMTNADQQAPAALLAETERSSDGYPNWYPGRRGRLASVFERDVHYILNYGTKQEELFRLGPNLDELADVSTTEPALLEAFRQQLQKMQSPGAPTVVRR